MLPTLQATAEMLAAGKTSARALTRAALERLEAAKDAGPIFLRLDRDAAMAAASASDRLREFGLVPSPLAGVPITLKDLFDQRGQPTAAGSRVLKDSPPATADAPVVARLRAAGAVVLGRTNMTEFAYSGLGLNPHYGTPGNPTDPARIPGGSSSGAGAAVARGLGVIGLGTDTGGSVRIPAAFCGVTGFKPTQARVPLSGCLPLSPSLDSIGPLAPSVACCAIADAVLAGRPPEPPPPLALAGLRLGVPRNLALDDLDTAVATTFQRALGRLSAAGARVVEFAMPELDDLPKLSAAGGLVAAEAHHWHRQLLRRARQDYDPRVAARIERGAAISAVDYLELQRQRRLLIERAAHASQPFDALAMPTVPMLAPRFAEIGDDAAFTRLNLLTLRNCSIANLLDRCAISLPCQRPGEPPVGFMLIGEQGGDRDLLALALAVEAALREPA
ncbi:MAG: amidase [Alphaproteobacteria bacterium]|nr:amidase [Alphaproteobacteria bacterium]